MDKWENNKAWFLVLPAFIIVAFSAFIPLMTVVNYSIQDIFGPGQSVFVGTEWYKEMLGNHRLHDALWRQFIFSGLVLLIEIPLGIMIGLAMPKRGWGVSASLVTLALPLVIPWNVIGTIWIIFTRPDIGLFGVGINSLDLLEVPFDHTAKPIYAWITLLAMEVWHWTPLVALLAYAGLRAIPEAYYQAAKIDGASAWAIIFLYSTAQNARRAYHCRAAALDGQFPDLCRTLCLDRRRTRQYDHLSVHLPGKAGHHAIRPGSGGGIFTDLLCHHTALLFRILSGPVERWKRRKGMKIQKRTIALCIYFGFLILPIYWMLNMSLRTNADILANFALYPADLTFVNYIKIFTDPSWYMAYINAMIYVGMNTAMSLAFALPAAYAFSRYKFLGDGQMFFWLLTNRMAPPAVFLLPYLQLYSTINLMDTHIAVALAHCLFNVPLAIWILEGFMSGIPKEIDETAFIDGYSFPRFFVTIFIPLIRAGVGVTAFFCFMFSWVELLFARTLTITAAKPITATMTRTISASGLDWGLMAAAGVLTIVPGALVIWFVRNYMAKGFALGRV